ncbi:arsenic-transporting ATPase [Halobacteriales archaeon QH_6_68_27]|nr:MAG: arsenic-transporting ATPase [Halobacteriales archaeon QH_6_68_27]
MSEIDVEPVEEIDDAAVPAGVDAPEYVLYGGKGGVGKTTMAAATALASARDGTPTLVVSTDPAHSLSDTLETSIPAEPAQIRDDDPLYAAEIDPDEALEEGPFAGDGENPMGGMLGGLGEAMGGGPMGGGPMGGNPTSDNGEGMVDPLGGSMPGADEALRQRLSGMMDSVTGMFGDDEEGQEMDVEDLRELRERVEVLRDVLQDPSRTDFRVVIVPEELSVRESERLLDRLADFGVPVGTVVVNRVMQELTDVADVEADWFVSPDLDNCEFCQRRWSVQRDALGRSQDIFRSHDVRRVPLFADEVRGEKLLRVVAACLEE